MRRNFVFAGLAAMLLVGLLLVRAERYTMTEAAIAAEHQYCVMEETLRLWLEGYERLNPMYHEYVYETENIGHERNELAAVLFALYGRGFSFAQVQYELETLFKKQYHVTETVNTRKRYVKGEMIDYHTCTVRLENRGLAAVAKEILGHEEYAVYEACLRELGTE